MKIFLTLLALSINKILTVFFLSLPCLLFAQNNVVEIKINGPETIKKKDYQIIKLEITNNSNDSIGFYLPGVITSSSFGDHFFQCPLYNIGVYYNDSILMYGGNCYPFTSPKKRYFLRNGFNFINTEKLPKMGQKIIFLKPSESISFKTIIEINDCLPLEKNESYILCLTYNHVEVYEPGVVYYDNYVYCCESRYKFIYKGK